MSPSFIFTGYKTPTQHRILQTYIMQERTGWGNVVYGGVNVQDAIFAYTGTPDSNEAHPVTFDDLETLLRDLLRAQQAITLSVAYNTSPPWGLEEVIEAVQLSYDALRLGNKALDPEHALSENFPKEDNDLTLDSIKSSLINNLNSVTISDATALANVLFNSLGVTSPHLTLDSLTSDISSTLAHTDMSASDLATNIATALAGLSEGANSTTIKNAIYSEYLITPSTEDIDNMVNDLARVEVLDDFAQIKAALNETIYNNGTAFPDPESMAIAILEVFTTLDTDRNTTLTVENLAADITTAIDSSLNYNGSLNTLA